MCGVENTAANPGGEGELDQDVLPPKIFICLSSHPGSHLILPQIRLNYHLLCMGGDNTQGSQTSATVVAYRRWPIPAKF